MNGFVAGESLDILKVWRAFRTVHSRLFAYPDDHTH